MYIAIGFILALGLVYYFGWPTVEKDVDKLVEGITSSVTKLTAASEAHAAAASIHTAQAAESTSLAEAAMVEAARAASIASKLQGLVS